MELPINRTQHVSITSDVNNIRKIKETIKEQTSQIAQLEDELVRINKFITELKGYVSKNKSTLDASYENI